MLKKATGVAAIVLFAIMAIGYIFSRDARDAANRGISDGLKPSEETWHRTFGKDRTTNRPSRAQIQDTLNLLNGSVEIHLAVWGTVLDSDITFDRAKRKVTEFESIIDDRTKLENADSKLRNSLAELVRLSYRKLGVVEMARKLETRARAGEVVDFELERLTSSSAQITADYDEWSAEYDIIRAKTAETYHLSLPVSTKPNKKQ